MNWLLKIVEGPQKGAEIALVGGRRVSFGSGDACDIVVADASLPAEACAFDVSEAGVTALSNNADLRFRALVDRMRRNPTKAFSMDETAAELKCAPNTVRALFHKYIGIPPQSFMLKCRIRKAQDLLKKGRSVMEIADALGFSSSQNFATRFRQETGMSPTDWKKQNL